MFGVKMRMLNIGKLLLTIPIVALGLALFIVSGMAAAEGPDDILIIVNKSVKTKKISEGEARAIFLKKKGSLGGSKITPINASDGSSVRKAFRKKVIGMTADEEAAYWEEQKIKKALSAPTEFGNTLKAVYSVKGSIGYCRRSQYKSGVVKIIAEI